MTTTNSTTIEIPQTVLPTVRECLDGEMPCAVCRSPVNVDGHQLWLWVHLGGNHAVTAAEGERLNAAGHSGADLGRQPIGPNCLKKYPQLKPFVMP